MIKRLSGIFLSFILCISMLAIPASASSTSFEVSLYREPIEFLKSLGVLYEQDEAFTEAEMTISRGEFARLAVNALGYRDCLNTLISYSSVYEDVNAKNAYALSIILATKLGLFGTNTQKHFYPDDNATIDWAMKIIVRMLGYGEIMQSNQKYIEIANRLRLYDNVTVRSNGDLNRGGAFYLIKNALCADMLIIEGIGTNGANYETYKGRNIMTEYLGVGSDTGIITADDKTALIDKKANTGCVIINHRSFLCSNELLKNMVGRNVTFYYKETSNDEYTIIYFKEKKNNTVTIAASDIQGYDYSSRSYKMFEEGKSSKLTLDMMALVSYNGSPVYSEKLMAPKTGQITLIDNNNDMIFDVVLIREFINIVVKYCNIYDGVIADIDDSAGLRTIRMDDFKSITFYNENRREVDFSTVKPSDVLTVYKNIDGTEAEVYISTYVPSKCLEEISLTENKIVADGMEYVISQDFRTLVYSLSESGKVLTREEALGNALKVGKKYNFYLNDWNEVVHIKAVSGLSAAYLLDIGKSKGISQTVSIKTLFEKTEEVTVLELAEKVRFRTYENGEKIITSLQAYDFLAPDGVINKQFLKLNQNSDGLVDEIIIAYSVAKRSELETMNDYPLIKMQYIVDEWPDFAKFDNTRAYYYSMNFGNWLYFAPTALEFHVPKTNAPYSDEDVYFGNVRYRANDKRTVTDFDVYMSGKDNIAADYVLKDLKDNIENQPYFKEYFIYPYTVTSVANCYDEELADATYRLGFLTRTGGEVTYMTKNANVIKASALIANGSTLVSGKTEIAPGDIVAFELDRKGKISELRLIYDGKNDAACYENKAMESDSVNCIVGTVNKKSDFFFEYEPTNISTENPGDNNRLICSLNNTILMYNLKNNTCEKVMASDLNEGDHVVICTRFGSVTMILIYR